MHQDDLNRWCDKKFISRIQIENPKVAELKDYKLDFNYRSPSRDSGAANIMEESGSSVFGLVFELDDEDYSKIKKKEGAPFFYKEIDVEVVVDGEIKEVKTFKVVSEKEADSFVKPSEEYLGLIIESAKKYGFPEGYVSMLENIVKKNQFKEEFK